ncbi:extradiol ring-cleavage dioxygenase [Kwoniella heveanensis BCC8398]|uniref:Extradiol ring-cleavage dioxygenase n=1 Tax=Kwoniella heveanensis BCC8398 TaxID=1296120 RepID=A0A1B9H4B6_9TREE|nr:extradiol ring-cleavage dioxygenase [Kwoniella heveanensis BCC8398]
MVNQTQSPAASLRRGDVYFLSHGGPPTIEQYESGPYKAWQKFGRTITAEKSKPKGIVAVSAHWENEDRYGPGAAGVIVNSNTTNPLIYDFGGFPKHFYQFQFRSNADPALQAKVVDVLKKDGIPVRREDRGLDHGVWIPFKAAFGDDSPLPIVQVSLPGTSDPQASVKLGKSLSKLRDEGYAIVATGQVVHNLRDLFTGRKMPYTKPFLQAVESALSSSDSTRANEDPSLSATLDLLNSPLYKKAHPTDEHFFPLLVALGAIHPRTSGEDSGASSAGDKSDIREKIYTGVVDIGGSPAEDTGLGWGMWRWTHTRANASS